MLITIKSKDLKVNVSTRGAELQSMQSSDGTEYLWQGDPAYWTSHAPNIFPYVARLTEGKFLYKGNAYGFGNHGLVRYADLAVVESAPDSVTYRLASDANTLRQYPFPFCYTMHYQVIENRLVMQTTVENTGSARMYFAVGGHPGFRVPLEDGLAFSDYYLEFDEPADPYRILLADSGAVTPRQERYALQDGTRIPLSHSLFDHDAIVLHNTAKTVRIKTDKGNRSVSVSFPDFRYVGFWHKPKTDAPYVCVEPWTSLPSREGIIENLALQSDLLFLDPGKQYQTEWWIEIA
jgi:galactose mutarotase-like enzyme